MARASVEIARYGLYGETSGAIQPEFVHIEDIASRSRLYQWTIAPHRHPGISQLLLIADGQARVTLDGVEVALTTPSLAVIPSDSVHAFTFSPETKGWVLSIANGLLQDNRSGLLPLIMDPSALRPGIIAMADDMPSFRRLHWLMTDIAERMMHPLANPSGMIPMLVAMILAVVQEARRHDRPLSGPSSRRLGLVRQFLPLVEAHYREQWAIGDYADRLGVTAASLTRACRAIENKAPGDIILDRLFLEATRYLSYTAATSSQISHQLGFADPTYFSRFFKKRAGMSTTQFRKTLHACAPMPIA